MELKRVGTVTVSGIPFQIFWKVDDVESLKWTFLHTDTTSYQRNKQAVRTKRLTRYFYVVDVHVPIHKGSETNASLLLFVTSIHSFPSFTTGHDFLHS